LVSRGDDCEYLFVTERKPYRQISTRNIERIIDKIEKRAKISKKLTPHVFRHTFATLAMENGADLADVQQLLGHENPSTTLVYAHVSEERKKQAHKRYHVQ
jgi:site-specific recombinase XerD